MSLLIAIGGLTWITWFEAARIEGARYTVTHGWGTGLAVGILASVGLTAVWAIAMLATRTRPGLSTRFQWPLALILVISWGICLRSTMPSNTPHTGPDLVTTGIEVGEMAYTATFSAWFIVLAVWGAVRRWRRARSAYLSTPTSPQGLSV